MVFLKISVLFRGAKLFPNESLTSQQIRRLSRGLAQPKIKFTPQNLNQIQSNFAVNFWPKKASYDLDQAKIKPKMKNCERKLIKNQTTKAAGFFLDVRFSLASFAGLLRVVLFSVDLFLPASFSFDLSKSLALSLTSLFNFALLASLLRLFIDLLIFLSGVNSPMRISLATGSLFQLLISNSRLNSSSCAYYTYLNVTCLRDRLCSDEVDSANCIQILCFVSRSTQLLSIIRRASMKDKHPGSAMVMGTVPSYSPAKHISASPTRLQWSILASAQAQSC